jgi:hypothetical protein
VTRRQRAARRSYHPPYAAQARSAPGTWLRVRAYETPGVAAFIASTIRAGTHPAYRPAGAYLADVRRAGDGYALWISYVPPETP